MALFKPLRGDESKMPATLTDGWAYFCSDTGNFYIDHVNSSGDLTRTQLNSNCANNIRYVDGDEFVEITAASIAEALSNLAEHIENDVPIYLHNEAPTDAKEGALWLDMDEEAAVSGSSSSDPGGGTSNAVQYIPQTLTEEQQMQARENLGLYHSEVVEILPETTVEIDPETGVGVGVIPAEFAVEDGKEYTVKYNGVEYVTTCLRATAEILILGNAGALQEGFPVTGEPFVLVYHSENGWGLAAMDGAESVTLSIEQKNISTIPEMYLPNAAVPFWVYVEHDGDKYSTAVTMKELFSAYSAGRIIMARVEGSSSTQFFLLPLISMNTDGLGFMEAVFATSELYSNKNVSFSCLKVDWNLGDTELKCTYRFNSMDITL